MSKKWKIILFIVLPLLLLIILIWAKSTGKIGEKEGISVEYAYPKRQTIISTTIANGRIRPVLEIKLSPEVSGEITELLVKEGQNVKKGDLLCRIKPDLYVSMRERSIATLSSSRARAAQSEASLKQAKQNYARMKQLHDEQAISDEEFERSKKELSIAENEVKAAKFTVASAEASLQESQESLAKTTIFAPMSATISKLSVELGERVVGTAQMAGTELMRLADLDRMEARVDVSESDIVNIHLHDTAMIHVDAYPDTTFKGIVTQISNTAIEARSQDQVVSFEVRILLLKESYSHLTPNGSESPFRPGMSVSVDIQTARVGNAITLPIEAVTVKKSDTVTDASNPLKPQEAVYILSGDTAYLQTVKTGIQDNRFIEIRSGISDSTRVIVSPYSAISRTLKDRCRVKATRKENK